MVCPPLEPPPRVCSAEYEKPISSSSYGHGIHDHIYVGRSIAVVPCPISILLHHDAVT